MIYLDTSALVKRFISEPGSAIVDEVAARLWPIATSRVAYAELFAGLNRKRRERDLTQARYRTAASEIERDWPTYLQVQVTDAVLLEARSLSELHPLRGFDALHLASALLLAQGTKLQLAFVAADQRLLDAAAAAGLDAIDATRSRKNQ